MALIAKETTHRNNNFNLLRMIAATAVIFSHAYPLALGEGTTEPLSSTLGMTLGTLAVLTFFATSGYFISKSFHNKRSHFDFVIARVLRIYPGLFVVLLITVLLLGPVFTTLDLTEYFSSRETWLYVPRNIRLWPLQYDLPGVFADNPYPGAINGSLWTLIYEVACYAMVAVVATSSKANNKWRFISFLIAFAVFYIVASPILESRPHDLTMLRNMHFLALPFVLGMALFEFRKSIPLRLDVTIALIVASVVSYGHPWFRELFILTWSYGIFYFGFFECKPLMAYNKLGDYSYGTYIYAFPVQQIVAHLCQGCTPLVMIAWSTPITILLAMLSWHLVEERALAQRTIVSAYLKHRRQ